MNADSIEVRKEIVARIQLGEITLEAGQAEIRRIVRKAKDAGEPTYFDAYRVPAPV